MSNKTRYGLIGFFLGAAIVWLLTVVILNPTNKVGMMNFQSSSQTGMQNFGKIDSHFIEQMIPHHEDAITMAKLAQTKAKKSEIKQLAKDIIDSQGKEINQMKDWYKEWFGRDVPTNTQVMSQHGMMGKSNGMHMGMMGDDSDMTRFEQSIDFDKAFIEEMIPHHQMAVMMANMLEGNTDRLEMKKLAADIISAQTKEIDQMRKWYGEWDY